MPQFISDLDLSRNELKNARIHNLQGAPDNPEDGQIYFSETTGLIYFWSTDSWIPVPGMTYRGIYSASIPYRVNDVVVYSSSTYVKTDASSAGTVPTNDTYWDLLVGGGTGTVLYTNATPVPATLGGVAMGSTFDNQTMQQMWDTLLYPYLSPSFSSFSMSGQSTTVEVGTTLSGSKTFTWATSNSSNVQANSVNITDANSATLASGLGSSGSTSPTLPSSISLSSPGSFTWTIHGTNTHSAQFSSNFSVSWRWRVYNGVSSSETLDENAIEALASNQLASSPLLTYSFGTGGYKFFAYPTSLAAASLFTDTSTQLSVTMADDTDNAFFSNTANGYKYGVVSVTNSLGVTTNYRVYRTRYVLGGSINIRIT